MTETRPPLGRPGKYIVAGDNYKGAQAKERIQPIGNRGATSCPGHSVPVLLRVLSPCCGCPSPAPPAQCRLQQWPGAKCKLSLYKMQVTAAIASNHNNHSTAAPFIGGTLSNTTQCNPRKVLISAPMAETRRLPAPGPGQCGRTQVHDIYQTNPAFLIRI